MSDIRCLTCEGTGKIVLFPLVYFMTRGLIGGRVCPECKGIGKIEVNGIMSFEHPSFEETIEYAKILQERNILVLHGLA